MEAEITSISLYNNEQTNMDTILSFSKLESHMLADVNKNNIESLGQLEVNTASLCNIEESSMQMNLHDHQESGSPLPQAQNLTNINVKHNSFAQTNADIKNSTTDHNYKFTCSECPRKYKLQQHLSKHMLSTHNMKSARKCPQCDDIFYCYTEVSRHIKKVHWKTLACSFCDIKFASQYKLRVHLKKAHQQLGDVKLCELCGAGFKNNYMLKCHMATHTDNRPFVCQVCNKAYRSAYMLKIHMDNHDANIWQCPLCCKEFNSRTQLYRHNVVHQEHPSKHKCNHCNKVFRRSHSLKHHLMLHAGLTPYTCAYCDKAFSQRSNLSAHKKRTHPMEWAEESINKPIDKHIVPKMADLKAITKNVRTLQTRKSPAIEPYFDAEEIARHCAFGTILNDCNLNESYDEMHSSNALHDYQLYDVE